MREITQEKLAIEGGDPVRRQPLPLEFPGVHYFGQEEIDAVVRILKSRSLFRYYGVELQGEVQAFEEEFAQFLGISHAIAVSSGTGALHVALSALSVGPGQEVIIPAYMWVSLAAAVVNHGAIPVLADIDETFCLDPCDLERHLSSRTTGVIVAHMSGAPANINEILKVARARGLFVLEDCAQCVGGSVGGQKVGTFGDIGIFSFQLNKNMTSGEGGCVVTNNRRLYQRAFGCHDLGYARDEKGRLILDDPDLCLWGRGYRMDELRAAILRVQLRKLPRIIQAMRRSKDRISKALEHFPQVQLRKVSDPDGDTGSFLITTYANAETAEWVNQALRAEGIVTFPQGISNVLMKDWGLHLYYNNASLVYRASIDRTGFPWNLKENAAGRLSYERGTCPVADGLFERSVIMAIPSCLTTNDEEDIIHAFEKVLGAAFAG